MSESPVLIQKNFHHTTYKEIMFAFCKTIGCRNSRVGGNDFCLSCSRKNTPDTESEYTGGSVSYYAVPVDDPISGGLSYVAECGDIIEALGMDFNEGNAFKAIWRKCAARTLGLKKKGYKDGLYDSEKVVYFGERMVAVESRKQTDE